MIRTLVLFIILPVLLPQWAMAYGETAYQYSQASYYSQATYYRQASYYSQATYYSQGTYYRQATYYSQPSYYSQGTYYSQASYYSQGYYQGSYGLTFTKNVFAKSSFAVTGNISKGSGTFVIDDPIDPANKLLYHSFVESPDVKNLYDGIATLDKNGEAVVALPSYFDALNTDVRYQLKPIGAAMPDLHVKEEEANNRFTIAGGVAGGKVSWQVTGIRHDPYIEANPIVPEVEKGKDQLVDKGVFLYPAGYVHPFPLSGLLGDVANYFARLFGRS
jgi:hypothetical protein